MGYYVRKQDGKKSSPNWKVQYISYKKVHSPKSLAKKPKKEWDISKHQWAELGFNRSMGLEQARARAAQLNAQSKSKAMEARQQIYIRNKKQFENDCRAVFPDEHDGRKPLSLQFFFFVMALQFCYSLGGFEPINGCITCSKSE